MFHLVICLFLDELVCLVKNVRPGKFGDAGWPDERRIFERPLAHIAGAPIALFRVGSFAPWREKT